VKALAYIIGGALGLVGITFLIASAQARTGPRVIIGLVLIAAALFIAALARSKVPDQRIIQQVDLSGDISPEKLTCKACGAPLDKDSVAVRAGGIFVSCPYCKTSYQLEEEPKW
jgi:hypothetical protein